uniref:Glycosyl transferase family 2 n=1 Tax=Variovorax paradoxus (strain S110) TaxID=543728 RepID=C5CVD1_VARPS
MIRVAVLLATHNGSKWIEAQIDSILNQIGVEVQIFVSDDRSSDNTLAILDDFARDERVSRLERVDAGYGSPAANFFRLLLEAPIEVDFEYVFLSDQDDYWLPNKIISAIQEMQLNKADCYASDLICTYPDGARRFLKKSYPQTKNDYLFQGASAGCTYGLSARAAVTFRDIIGRLGDAVRKDISHDWAIYAVTRSHGFQWTLDARAYIDYRQHGENAYGALGLDSYRKRWLLLKNGWYRKNVLVLASVCLLSKEQQKIIDAVKRWYFRDRFFLLSKVWSFRRRPIEKVCVGILIVLGLF